MTIILWYLFVIAYILEKFLSWYFNVYIITNYRIIDTDFYSLLFKHISEARYNRIEDITYTQGGILQSIFDYGDVSIQTAAEVPEIRFELVPQPSRVVRVLDEFCDKPE